MHVRKKLKDGLNLDRDSGRKRGESHRGAGVISVAVLAENLVVKIRALPQVKMTPGHEKNGDTLTHN